MKDASLSAGLVEIDSIAPGCCYSFRITFRSTSSRLLLPYPCATELVFRDLASGEQATWYYRRLLAGVPLDTFCINPLAAISFELHANFCFSGLFHNAPCRLSLGNGRFDVRYSCFIRTKYDRYIDRLQNAALTARASSFFGEVESNSVELSHSLSPPGAT